MDIKKFKDFHLNEAEKSHENPEEYIGNKLDQIKHKVDKMFAEDSVEENDPISFKEMGLKLESSEICKFSKMYDSLQVKYSDDKFFYSIYFIIKLDQAMNGKTPSEDSIKKCFVKFRKYRIKDVELIGKISKEVEIKDINKELLISLKDDLDKKFDDNNEDDFKIEFEE